MLTRRTALTLGLAGLLGLAACTSGETRRTAERCRAVPGVAELEMTDQVSFASAAELWLLLAPGLDAAAAHRTVAEVCRICSADGWSGALEVRRLPDSPERVAASTSSPPGAALLADWFTVGDAVDGSVFISATGPDGQLVDGASCQIRSTDVATDLEQCVGLGTTSFARWVLEDVEAWERCTVPQPETADVEDWRRLTASTRPLPATLRHASWTSSRLPDLRQLELAVRLGDDRAPEEVRAADLLPVLTPMLETAGLTGSTVDAVGLVTFDLTLLRFDTRREYLGSWRSDGRTVGGSSPLDDDLEDLLPLPG